MESLKIGPDGISINKGNQIKDKPMIAEVSP